MDCDWFICKLQELEEKDQKVDILCEIYNRINNGIPDSKIIANILSSKNFFIHLKIDTPQEESAVAFNILKICLFHLNIRSSDISCLTELSLKHKNPKVQALFLMELDKKLQDNHSLTSSIDEVILQIIVCLDALEVEIGVLAIKILSNLLIDGLDNPLIMTSFLGRQQKESLIRLRFYEVTVNLAKVSPKMLEKVQNLLDDLLSELQKDDLLIQLNILELIVSLAEKNHGLLFLEDRKFLELISRRIENINSYPLDNILLPSFYKFFGKIAYNHPKKIIGKYPIVIKSVLSSLQSNDISVLPIIFDTIANFAHSSEGKILLNENFSSNMKEYFEELSSILKNLSTDIRIRAFDSLSFIFRPDNDYKNETEQITAKWCSYLNSSEDLQYILNICKNPIPEIKRACLNFVKNLCSYKWAINAIKYTAGFIEYLLDRKVEFDKEVKFLKFEINKILSESTIFDASTILCLKKYVNEGPYYVEAIVDIAIEGSN